MHSSDEIKYLHLSIPLSLSLLLYTLLLLSTMNFAPQRGPAACFPEKRFRPLFRISFPLHFHSFSSRLVSSVLIVGVLSI
jgi:hypothetical protein